MDNNRNTPVKANLMKKDIGRFVLYKELSKYYTMEEIDQMLATISEGGFVDLGSYLKKSEIENELSPTSVFPVSSECLYSVIQGLTARIDELERKVAYYHPEGDTVEFITWSDYSISPSTVPVGLAATFIPGTVMAVYKSGRQEDVTSSAVFNAHRGSIADHTYIAPSTAGEDTIRASYSGKVADSILTVTIEEAVITDYYIGWTTGTKAQFASKTDNEMINGATGFSSTVNPNYTHAFGSNNIFYLMYQANKAPRKVTLTSQGVPMDQDLVNDNVCPHNDVTIDGVAYKVFGIRMATGYDQADTMTVNF